MLLYHEQLQALHTAITQNNNDNMLPLVKSVSGAAFSAQERIAVYATGYAARLEEAVQADYPALSHYMGQQECKRLIHDFVRNTLSTYWDLNCYPIAFADFLQHHTPYQPAHALAHLESAIVEVFWLPESTPLKPEALIGMAEDELGRQRFSLRRAARLLHLDYAANTYLTAFRQDAAPEMMQEIAEYVLVIRHQNEVQRLALEPSEYALLSAMQANHTFEEALTKVNDSDLAEKLPHYLCRWLENGVFTGDCD